MSPSARSGRSHAGTRSRAAVLPPATARCRWLGGSLELGPLHGPRRPDGPGRRELDDPRDGRGADRTRDRRDLRDERRESALRRSSHPMAATLQIVSGGRLVLGIRIGGAPKEHAAYGMAFPDAARAGRTARGGGRGHPGVMNLASRRARLAVLLRCALLPCPSCSRPTTTDHQVGGETAEGARLAGRDRRRLVCVRRQRRGEPAALSRVARGVGRKRADQRVLVGFQGARAPDRSIADSPGDCAPRETWGDAGGGRRRWRHRPGPPDAHIDVVMEGSVLVVAPSGL